MSCGYQALIDRIVNLVIKHYLCSFCGLIDDVYARMHTIFDGFLPLEAHLHQRCIVAMIKVPHLGQVVLIAKLLAGILEI